MILTLALTLSIESKPSVVHQSRATSSGTRDRKTTTHTSMVLER